MATRNQNGQFVGAQKDTESDDRTLTESDFRRNHIAVGELVAFLESDAGKMMRMVLRGRRRGMVKVVHVKPDEAAAQLAKIQAFEELVELITERLTLREETPTPPVSRKGGAGGPLSNVAMMP